MRGIVTSSILFAALLPAGLLAQPGGSNPPGGCESVTQQTQIGAQWSCIFPPFCSSDYNALPQRAPQYRQPISQIQLWGQLLQLLTGTAHLVSSADLKIALPAALNIGFLVNGLTSRSLTVTTISDGIFSDNGSQYRERNLLISDPYVGTFEGILITPVGVASYPVVLALHGHGETAQQYRDLYFARDYPKNGLGILMITFRVMDPWLGEHDVSEDLLENGFSLIGLRAYEALASLRYLACNSEVQPGRIGLIGHSGGSSTSNLVVRIAPERVAAYVSDYQIDYSKLNAPEPWHCETVPKVYPYHNLINNFQTLPTSVAFLSAPYGYTNYSQNILNFFASRLGASLAH